MKSRKLYSGAQENEDKEAEKRIHNMEKKIEKMVVVVNISFFWFIYLDGNSTKY